MATSISDIGKRQAMKRLIIAAALLACGAAAAAQPQREAIENRYYGWRPVSVDQTGGAASFVAGAGRAGNAVLFQILSVHRSVIERNGARYDKEMTGMLGDCGSRTILTTTYLYQLGDALTPPPIISPPAAAVARPGSDEDKMLTFACRETQADPIVEHPYAWAKARLSEPVR
jgi:hypothetical protein